MSKPERVSAFHNLNAEMAVLGAVLADNGAWPRAAEHIAAEDFNEPANRALWKTISNLIKAGRVADGVTLAQHFRADDDMQAIGGARYLADLLDSAAFGPETGDYARLIRELAVRRRVRAAGEALVRRAEDPRTARQTPEQFLGLVMEELQAVGTTIAPDRWKDSRAETIRALTEAARGEQRSAVETGIEQLDRKIGGFYRGELVVLGGRPGMGKSALIDQVEMNVAERVSPDPAVGSPPPLKDEGGARRLVVAKFSLEMGEDQLAYRNGSRILHRTEGRQVSYSDIRKGKFDLEDGRALTRAMEHLPTVHWDTTAAIDLAHIRTQAHRLKKRYGRLDLITCDYLQIMETQVERGQTQAHVLGQITKGCKAIARELDVPFVLLSQLSRDVEKRDDKRPVMSDLRDSGSIEADADTVLFCLREHYYLSRQPEPKDAGKRAEHEATLADCEPKMTVIVAKQRMGAPCDVGLYWSAATSLIVSKRDDLHPDFGRMFA